MIAVLFALASTAPVISSNCPNPSGRYARSAKTMPKVHKLNEEPNASQMLGVMHTEGRCLKPIVVRSDIGGKDRRAPAVHATEPVRMPD